MMSRSPSAFSNCAASRIIVNETPDDLAALMIRLENIKSRTNTRTAVVEAIKITYPHLVPLATTAAHYGRACRAGDNLRQVVRPQETAAAVALVAGKVFSSFGAGNSSQSSGNRHNAGLAQGKAVDAGTIFA